MLWLFYPHSLLIVKAFLTQIVILDPFKRDFFAAIISDITSPGKPEFLVQRLFRSKTSLYFSTSDSMGGSFACVALRNRRNILYIYTGHILSFPSIGPKRL